MPLIKWRYRGRKRNLLVIVGGIDLKVAVEDGDAVVGVVGGDGDLELGGEEVRLG